jgi:hypothetical protein
MRRIYTFASHLVMRGLAPLDAWTAAAELRITSMTTVGFEEGKAVTNLPGEGPAVPPLRRVSSIAPGRPPRGLSGPLSGGQGQRAGSAVAHKRQRDERALDESPRGSIGEL